MKISQFALANFVFYSIIDKGGSKMKKICNLLIALVLLFVPIVCLADSDKKADNTLLVVIHTPRVQRRDTIHIQLDMKKKTKKALD